MIGRETRMLLRHYLEQGARVSKQTVGLPGELTRPQAPTPRHARGFFAARATRIEDGLQPGVSGDSWLALAGRRPSAPASAKTRCARAFLTWA